MRFDVIACAYRNWKYLPCFLWGLEQNKDRIASVTIVQDELRPLPELPSYIRGICQEHDGHGVGRAYNLAAKNATQDFILTTHLDLVLTPFSLDVFAAAAEEQILSVGQVHIINDGTTVEQLEVDPPVARRDCYEPHIVSIEEAGEHWKYARNGFTVYPLKSFREIGGFEERFGPLGYGNEDYELALRWQMQFGLRSIEYVWGAEAWHFGDAIPTTNLKAKRPSKENQMLFEARLREWKEWKAKQ